MIFFKKILRKNFEMDRFETDRSKAQRQSRYGPKKKKFLILKKPKKTNFERNGSKLSKLTSSKRQRYIPKKKTEYIGSVSFESFVSELYIFWFFLKLKNYSKAQNRS
jgi:hypothetical protein